jgi:general secretion pathway protein F
MAVYAYKAINKSGKPTKGVIDAENLRSARQKLKSDGIFPTELHESRTRESSFNLSGNINLNRPKRVTTSQLSVVTRQFATLVAAGMPLVESLKALGDQIDHTTLKEVIAEIRDKVNEGDNLANSLEQYPNIFPRLYVNMVASGEASGSLDLVLERLADLLESQAELQRKFVSALTYPVLMLLLCFGVILLLLGYVVPQITTIFENQGATLPLPTKIVIAASDFVKSYWWVLIGMLVAGVFGIKAYAKTPQGKQKLDRLFLRLPLLGPLRLKIATSRFSRNLGTMLASGIRLLGALGIVKNILGNVVLEEAVDSAIEGVREGGNLADELDKAHLFPSLLIHMIAIGERTGQLEQMLGRAASAYESEVDAVISGFTSVLEPLLIIFLAFVVGAILAAVMLPMLEMTSLAG